MNYNDLINILLTDKPSILIKENEKDIFDLVPELKLSKGFNQNTIWHIYDVYNHTLNVIDNVDNNILLRITAFFHDIGKPFVYYEDELGKGHFKGHWNKSLEIFNNYKDKFNLSEKEKNIISNLILYHDIRVEKMSVEEIGNLVNILTKEEIIILYKIKRSDLLSQNPKFHYMLEDYDKQEIKILSKYKVDL